MNAIERIKDICKERHIAISKLERECGFSNGYIAGKKTGKIPADRLLIISDYLGVSYSYLLYGTTGRDIRGNDIRTETIIDCFNKLNETGKSLLFDVAVGLAHNPGYTKKEESLKDGS